jgi:hypothetical protein
MTDLISRVVRMFVLCVVCCWVFLEKHDDRPHDDHVTWPFPGSTK